MNCTKDEVEMLKYFCLRVINDLDSDEWNLPFIKFVFNDDDYKDIMRYLKKLGDLDTGVRLNIKTNLSKRFVFNYEVWEAIEKLEKMREEFKNNRDENSYYIEIPNAVHFFRLLHAILKKYQENEYYDFNFTGLLHTIWLRMGPNDINSVNKFLKRQLAFIGNDSLLSVFEKDLEEYDSLTVSYVNSSNVNFFETNRHIRPIIKRKTGESYDEFLGTVDEFAYYTLPVIHYGLIMENGEATCYVYGIQNLLGDNERDKDNEITEMIRPEKRRLRNKDVSADMIIALKIFIDIMKKHGITSIKVPLLQVMNYDYHKAVGESCRKDFERYSKDTIRRLELIGCTDSEFEEYKNIEKQYKRFFGKEDMISLNKTERLLKTFYMLSEMYENIQILSDSFIESDVLLCRVNYAKEKGQQM